MKKNEPAFPLDRADFLNAGLTKREYFAAMALPAAATLLPKARQQDGKVLAAYAVVLADALLAALEEEESTK